MHKREHERLHLRVPYVRRARFAVDSLKRSYFLLFLNKGLYHLYAAELFLHKIGNPGEHFLPFGKALMHLPPDKHAHESDHTEWYNRDKAQPEVYLEYHLQQRGDADGYHIKTHHYRCRKRHAHGLDIVGHVCHYLARVMLMEIRYRQRVKMAEKIVSHIALYFSCRTEYAVSPPYPARQNQYGYNGHPYDCRRKAGFINGRVLYSVYDLADYAGNLRLRAVYHYKYSHAEQIAPFVLFEKPVCVRAAQNVHYACLTRFLLLHYSLLHL